MSPFASAIGSCCSQARCLPAYVDTLHGQTRGEWDAIAVDDGTPEKTAIVESALSIACLNHWSLRWSRTSEAVHRRGVVDEGLPIGRVTTATWRVWCHELIARAVDWVSAITTEWVRHHSRPWPSLKKRVQWVKQAAVSVRVVVLDCSRKPELSSVVKAIATDFASLCWHRTLSRSAARLSRRAWSPRDIVGRHLTALTLQASAHWSDSRESQVLCGCPASRG